jgi:hypothetical protein
MGVLPMWVQMNCAICGYRESTDYDPRTVEEIQTVCDNGCPLCGNTDDHNPVWFQYGPDGELARELSDTGNTLGPVFWWPANTTPEHQQRIDAGLCKTPPPAPRRG